MKTIGMIGGTGWVSSAEYYRLINLKANNKLGGLESARCILFSLNYGEINRLNISGKQNQIRDMLIDAARKLQRIGSDGIALCANTLHLYADDVARSIKIPLLHIGDAVAGVLQTQGYNKAGLLGTITTMKKDFYHTRLKKYNIETLVPDEDDQFFVHQSIINELLKNIFLEKTKERFLNICHSLYNHGAEAIILGCTEIPLMIKQNDLDIPVLDTLNLHVDSLVDFVIEKHK